MYTRGHCGVSLLVYAPVGVGLTLFGFASAAVAGGLVMLALAMVPDCDHCLPRIDHRGPTHSLTFALATGTTLALATWLFVAHPPVGGTVGAGLFAFAIGTLAIVAHLAADLLTPMGIAPFWPVSNHRYSLDLTPANDPTANDVLLGVGIAVTAIDVYLLSLVA